MILTLCNAQIREVRTGGLNPLSMAVDSTGTPTPIFFFAICFLICPYTCLFKNRGYVSSSQKEKQLLGIYPKEINLEVSHQMPKKGDVAEIKYYDFLS